MNEDREDSARATATGSGLRQNILKHFDLALDYENGI